MSIAELRKLPPAEKLKIIEALWGDWAADEDSFSSPAWHERPIRRQFQLARYRSEFQGSFPLPSTPNPKS